MSACAQVSDCGWHVLEYLIVVGMPRAQKLVIILLKDEPACLELENLSLQLGEWFGMPRGWELTTI